MESFHGKYDEEKHLSKEREFFSWNSSQCCCRWKHMKNLCLRRIFNIKFCADIFSEWSGDCIKKKMLSSHSAALFLSLLVSFIDFFLIVMFNLYSLDDSIFFSTFVDSQKKKFLNLTVEIVAVYHCQKLHCDFFSVSQKVSKKNKRKKLKFKKDLKITVEVKNILSSFMLFDRSVWNFLRFSSMFDLITFNIYLSSHKYNFFIIFFFPNEWKKSLNTPLFTMKLRK